MPLFACLLVLPMILYYPYETLFGRILRLVDVASGVAEKLPVPRLSYKYMDP